MRQFTFLKNLAKTSLIFLLSFSTNVFAQLSGTYTIPGNYTTFTDAVGALTTQGISGAVIFNVSPGNYPEIIGGVSGIPDIVGTSATNTITFQKNGTGNVLVNPLVSASPNAAVYINGGDYLIFDGINVKPDSLSAIGFYGFYITGGSSNLEIKNCNIQTSMPSLATTNYRAIYQNQSPAGSTNNNNNFHHNVVTNSYYGIYLNGNNASYDSNNSIFNNEIHDIASYGIYFNLQNSGKIYNNEIHNINASTTAYGIYSLCSNPADTIKVYNNKIHTMTGTTVGGIYFAGSTTVKKVYNNMIYNYLNTGISYGIYSSSPTANNDSYYFNTVAIEGSSASASYAFYNTTPTNVTLKNNIFFNNKTAGAAYAIYKGGGSFLSSDNNNFYVNTINPNAKIGFWGSTAQTTLADWQTASSQDAASLNSLPPFISTTDVHINPTQFTPMDNAGTSIAGITTDIDNETRNSPPDIGADEFGGVILTHDVGILGTISFNPTIVLQGTSQNFSVKVKNFTTTAETFDVTATLDGGATNLGTVNVSLAGNDTTTVTFDWANPVSGNHTIQIQTMLSTDQFAQNNTVSVNFFVFGTCSVPFVDNFINNILDINLWTNTSVTDGNGFVNSIAPNPVSPTNALHLNATPAGADTVTSCVINLTSLPSAQFSFWYEKGGGVEAPDTGEFLRAEYLNNAGNWLQIPNAIIEGNSTLQTSFTQIVTTIPPDGMHAAFRFRFRSNGTSSATSFFDDFAIDNVYLGPPPNYNVSFAKPSITGNINPNGTKKHYLLVQNIGLLADSYNIGVTSTVFPAVAKINGNTVTNTGIIQPGSSVTLAIWVTPPTSATVGSSAQTTVVVTSTNDPTASANASITTNVVNSFGGPDSFGHSWVSNIGNDNQINFVNIANLPGAVNLNLANNAFSNVTLPFTFPYFTDTFTTMNISSNGFVNFGTGSTLANGQTGICFPNTTAPNGVISPFWDDLNPAGGGQVWYYVDPIQPRVIVQWNQVVASSGTTPNTFEAILWVDGTIEFVYLDVDDADLVNASVGIENLLATVGLQIINDAPFLQDSLHVIISTEDNFPPVVTNFTQIKDTDVHDQNFPVWVRATDFLSGVQADSVEFFWKFSTDTIWNNVPMTPAANDSFFAQIPAPNQFNVVLEYFMTATDADTGENTAYFPYNPTNGTGTPYSFKVRLITPGTLTGESGFAGYVPLAWGQPGENGIEIKYDDGTSEFQSIIPNSPPGLNSPGPATIASKFNIATQTQIIGPAQLNSIKFYIANGALPASTYKVKIYDADGTTGLPNNVLWESTTFDQTGAAGTFVNLDLTNPVTGAGLPIGSGVFFVGIEQPGTDKISLGGDTTLNPPYIFNQDTHLVQPTGGSWATIESLLPVYGNIIPMIRCFVEPLVVAPLPPKNNNQISVVPSWNVTGYKLYKLNGAALSSDEIVTNGSVIFNGAAQNYDDYAVVSQNQYSYAATVLYDVNGTNTESKPGNFVVAIPNASTGTPEIQANDVNFGTIAPSVPAFANVVIKSVGLLPLQVTAMNFSGSTAFNLSPTNPPTFPFTIPAGDSALVELSCFSAAQGNFSGALEIVSNASTNPNYTVNLLAVIVNAAENQNLVPTVFSIEQNFPNPFNPVTNIKFGIPEKTFTRLAVYNILGQLVKIIVNKELTPSYYTFRWNGTDESGKQVSSGIYFYQLKAENFSETKKMLLVK
ncbi:right-handed parallel beta-helix repeat-containing protein [bacterium]|nr:right-handed parallel beta-helix repeat-containing protein [bacterium]